MVPPLPPGSEAALPRRWQWLRRAAGVAMAALLLLWGVLLAAWLTLHWLILPHIDEWRPSIEKFAGEAIGLKLTVGEIRVQSGGWVPAFELQDLRLFDPQGREALHLARVHTALAPQSLLALTLRFEQVLIDGARLEVRRDAAGRWHVAGFALDQAGDGRNEARARDWLLQQREVVVRNAELHWDDERSGAPPVALTQLELVLRNGLRRHALRLDATPPPDWGERFSLRGRFSQPLLAPAGDWSRWHGTLFAEFPQADAAALRRHLELPLELGEGEGALRAWVDIADGMPRQATLDFALHAVALRLAPSLRQLQLQQLQGRVEVERDAAGLRLRAHDLAFLTDDGLAWPAGGLTLAWRQQQDLHEPWTTSTPVTGGEVAAERLQLQTLTRIAEHLPLAEPLRAQLATLAPRGTVDSLKARWTGLLPQPASWQLDARLSGLTLQPGQAPRGQPARPGLHRAGLQLSANEHGGEARLQIREGSLTLPGVFEQPQIPFDELQAALSWRLSAAAGRPPAIEVKLSDAHFANADARGEAEAAWHSGEGSGGRFPGRLELTAQLDRARAASVARYLPLGIDAAAREHVRDAVQGGSISSARFSIKGDLADFPFDGKREGEMRIVLQLRDLRYAYLPAPWPAVEQASGEIEFDRLALKLRRLQGRLWGYELRDVQGGIADLGAAQPLLTLQGQGRGPAADLLRFARLAPPGPAAAAALEPLSITGPSELTLAVGIPLAGDAPPTLRGSLRLAGNDLRLDPALPPLLGARGSIDFSPQALQLRTLNARVLGGDTSVEGSIAADGAMRFNAQGTASAEALRALPQPALARLGEQLRGQAAWRGTLAVADGRRDLMLQSNLVGMEIDLPAPLAKPQAGAALPLRLQLAPPDDAAAPNAHPRDQLQLELGELLKAQFQRDLSAAEPRVLRGSVAVLDKLPPLPDTGVMAQLNLGRVDLDAWQALLERSGAPAEPAPGGYLPQIIRLRADELRSGGRRLSQVAATLSSQGTPAEPWWKAQLSADQMAGDIEYRPPRGSAQAGRVTARLQRLAVPQSEVSAVEGLLSQPPASVPALDIVVDEFELRGLKLGRLQVLAVNRQLPGRAGQREWQLDQLDLDVPEAQLRATGRWAASGARRMALDFRLALADSGALLQRVGAAEAMRGGKGELQGRLSWAGSPLTLDYPSLEGQVRLQVDAGQFLHANPGGTRLLGVLSLQSLPRRFSLDFRDLFQQGFAFDSIDGEVRVARGVAHTSDLRMQGAQATVLMQGSADLLHETQDLRVLVVPKFDAAGAALATMAINPAIGLGALFAQWALREPLIAAGTSELHITGSWAEPQVTRVARQTEAPAEPGSAPAPAPAPAPPPAPPAGGHSTDRRPAG
ncbi:MAG TPA: YhdP family protein [Rubrivivax sp.]|nr:YhdP family protein [Rubrivivax sp.]